MSHSLFLYDDEVAQSWEPFSLTRPAGELLFGAFLLRERAEAYWGSVCSGHISGNSLAGFTETGAPPVLSPNQISSEGYRIVQVSRVALSGKPPAPPKAPTTYFVDGTPVGFALPPGSATPDGDFFRNPQHTPGFERIEVQGRVLHAPWDLMAQNAHQLREDIPRSFPGYAVDQLPGCHILGNELLSLGTGVVVEPGSVFDVTAGPIRLSDGVLVGSHTRLEGPAFIGAHSSVMGGALSEVSMGPVCKIRGEMEASVVLGYTNKAHDGFLGHAYLGRWVNLGAFTTNSDLKNNYGPVRVGSSEGPKDTGLMKVGAFLGDHVKTGIGTLLNTGTVVGAGSNIYGGKMPPTFVPPFSWGTGEDLTEFRMDKFLEVAIRAMARREMELHPDMEGLLRRAWESTKSLRHKSTGP